MQEKGNRKPKNKEKEIEIGDRKRKRMSRVMYYKTFYDRNLQIFVTARVFVPGKPHHPSIMFVGKARGLP